MAEATHQTRSHHRPAHRRHRHQAAQKPVQHAEQATCAWPTQTAEQWEQPAA